MSRSSCLALSLPSLASLVAGLLVTFPAAAQDEPPPPAAPVATAPAAPAEPVADPKAPSWSIAIERVGGVGYAKASSDSGDESVSLTALGVGGATPNPFAIPRVGIDYITSGGVTIGGGVGFTRLSASSSDNNRSDDIGSVFLYTLTPRVGYRIPLSERVDFTPRAGLTLAGVSFSPPSGNNGASIFAVAVGADAPFAFRLTDSFNLLAGAAVDYTVAATVTTESTTTTVGTGGGTTSTTTSSREQDIKGSLFSLQGWLGLGGYL